MRGTVPGLDTAHPLGGTLPAVYAEDGFAMRLTQAFDDVLAPVPASLDCLDAYVDPLLAPEDFLGWLAGWCAMAVDENLPVRRQRALVGAAAELYRARGTVAGLRAHLELAAGGTAEVTDSGGVTWSVTPDELLDDDAEGPWVSVRVTGSEVNPRTLDALIGAIKPAHVPHRLEVAER